MLRRISYFILGLLLGAVAMIYWASNADAVEYSPNGTSGLTLAFNGNDDDNAYTVNLPWTINFLGTNYNSVYVGTNGYITFSSPNSTYGGFSASNPSGPHISIYPADRRLYKLYYAEIAAGTAQARFVIRAEGVDYSNAAITHIWEVHFYPGTSYFDIYFVDAPSSGNAGTTGISNGTSYVLTYTTTELTGIRINANGTLDVGAAPAYSSSISGAQTIRKNNLITNRNNVTNNNIYIDQAGDNNTITIEQSGNNNSIQGINQQRAKLLGNGNNITIKQGDPIDLTGKNLIKLETDGASNTLNLTQGRNPITGLADGAESNGHIISLGITGNSNNVTAKQSNDGGNNSGHFAEINISGNTNTLNLTQGNNTGKTLFGSVTGNNNSLTASQTGTGADFLDITLTGNGHNVNSAQSGAGNHAATINLTNSGGASSVTLTQGGSTAQTYSIQQSCTNPAGCSVSVTQP